MRNRSVLFFTMFLIVALFSLSLDATAKQGSAPKGGKRKMSVMQLVSAAFAHKGSIPTRYTCQGANISPPLSLVNVPEKAKSLALIVDDPDAPDPNAPKTVWVHWVVYNIPPNTESLTEGGPLPKEAVEGLNDWKKTGWGGPCPPIGKHRYFFKLFALSEVLAPLKSPTKAELLKAMEGKIIAQSELMGTYQK